MQLAPRYDDVVAEVERELAERVEACLDAGIRRERLVLDPGIGFGKRLEDNLDLLAGLSRLRGLGAPLLVGVSRKAFLGKLLGRPDPGERAFGTAAAVAACVLGGASWLRVHDVREMADVVRVAAAIRARAGTWRPLGDSAK
jgi:dihydropteroate synthase